MCVCGVVVVSRLVGEAKFADVGIVDEADGGETVDDHVALAGRARARVVASPERREPAEALAGIAVPLDFEVHAVLVDKNALDPAERALVRILARVFRNVGVPLVDRDAGLARGNFAGEVGGDLLGVLAVERLVDRVVIRPRPEGNVDRLAPLALVRERELVHIAEFELFHLAFAFLKEVVVLLAA